MMKGFGTLVVASNMAMDDWLFDCLIIQTHFVVVWDLLYKELGSFEIISTKVCCLLKIVRNVVLYNKKKSISHGLNCCTRQK